MASSTAVDRSLEIQRDLSSLARRGGHELVRSVFREFCARKKIEPLLDEFDIEGSITTQICTLNDRFRGQFRQSVCKAIKKARQ
ncbi:hypothetical protein KKC44_05435 [Patescibacteria group bacterium]|nr:hypothetical protein [Patescibacteria group bacterium]MBU2260016.1 hypothetical protein [Patescibacteria group bacterium]